MCMHARARVCMCVCVAREKQECLNGQYVLFVFGSVWVMVRVGVSVIALSVGRCDFCCSKCMYAYDADRLQDAHSLTFKTFIQAVCAF